MCPGGYVVNASSEPGRLAVNGMSYHDRAGENANSAIIVSVTPESHDNDEKNPLSGIYFQRELEEKAYQAAGGNIPVQLYGDFISDCTSDHFGKVQPASGAVWVCKPAPDLAGGIVCFFYRGYGRLRPYDKGL